MYVRVIWMCTIFFPFERAFDCACVCFVGVDLSLFVLYQSIHSGVNKYGAVISLLENTYTINNLISSIIDMRM